MTYGRMPLFPPGFSQPQALRVPLFGDCAQKSCGCAPRSCGCTPPRDCCQTVRFQNPACPEESADVELCLDECGNLSICVRHCPNLFPPCVKRRRPRCERSDW